MSFLTVLQAVNTTLSTVDTARNLVSSPQGSGTPDEVLSQNIQAMGARVTAAVHEGVGVLRQELLTVENMLSHVIAQQGVLQREIQKVIGGIGELRLLMSSHMQTVEAQLRFVIEQPLQEAIQSLSNHLGNTTGIGATPEEIRGWLRTLENWITGDSTHPVMNHTLPTITSEVAATLLAKSPDNIGLIASRMRLLCGDEIPETFLSLPPIELYATVLALYLTALEKNPHLMSDDKAATVCKQIEKTLNSYLEYFKFIKDNERFIQALFDQYQHYQRKNPTQYRFLLEEIKALIKAQLPLMNNERFNAQLTVLDASSQPLALMNSSTDIWDHVPKGLPESERINRLFRVLNQEDTPTVASTKYMIIPEEMNYVQIPSCITYYSTDQGSIFKPNPDYPSYTRPWGDLHPGHYRTHTPYRPKPPAFCTNSLLLLCLAAGYAEIDFFQRSTLKHHLTHLLSALDNHLSKLYWNYHPDGSREKVYYVSRDGYDSTNGIYVTDCHKIKLGLMDVLPIEYAALLNSASSGVLKLDKLKIAFRYLALIFRGDLAQAKSFSRNNRVEPSCLLFLVSIVGRLDIFENFVKQSPLPDNFNYAQTAEGGTLNPLMFAAQLGHGEVVDYLSSKMKTVDIIRVSSKNQTAAQLALKNGFYKIAHVLYQCGRGGLTVTELATVQATLPSVQLVVPNQVSTSSPYPIQLVGMLGNVSASKTKLSQYVPPQAQSASPAPAAEMQTPDDSGYITSDEMEETVEGTAREFFSEHNMHLERSVPFFKKSTERRYQKTGYRVIDDAEFNNDAQRNMFFGRLDKREFRVHRLKNEKQILVQLPSMSTN